MLKNSRPAVLDDQRPATCLLKYTQYVLLGILVVILSACQTTREPMMSDITFTASHDGTEQRFVAVKPASQNTKYYRDAIIALHGHGSDRWQFVKDARPECSATRNFALAHHMLFISPDYRASTSWMGPAAEADLLDVIAYMKRHWRVHRVFLCGGSMGGTSALAFSVRHPELLSGVAAMNGTANLVEYKGFQDAIAASYGGTKEQVPDEYRGRSAEFFPQHLTMPVAMTAGGKDDIVPPESCQRLYEVLRQGNTPVSLIYRAEGLHATNYEDAMSALEFIFQNAR